MNNALKKIVAVTGAHFCARLSVRSIALVCSLGCAGLGNAVAAPNEGANPHPRKEERMAQHAQVREALKAERQAARLESRIEARQDSRVESRQDNRVDPRQEGRIDPRQFDNRQFDSRQSDSRQIDNRQIDNRGGETRAEERHRIQQEMVQRNPEAFKRNGRLTPDERRDLRRQINEAGQDIYANTPRR